MPPPLDHPSLNLQLWSQPFFVLQLQRDEEIPSSIIELLKRGPSQFLSVTRTHEETSLVGEYHDWMPQNFKEKSTWSCIKIMGPMEHNLTGILAAFSLPLKLAEIPIFALSTWNTDYVLVPSVMAKEAVNALKEDGWAFV
ncbi:ACT domain containing protein [Amanita muscaria]